MAASGLQEEDAGDLSPDQLTDSNGNSGKQSFIEQYTQGISAVETILALDQLRQSVVVKELVKNKALMSNSQTECTLMAQQQQQQLQNQMMRKTMSVPNFSQVSICMEPCTMSWDRDISRKFYVPN